MLYLLVEEAQAHELEASLENIQSLTKFKDELTQMLVHDLKNPINTIINLPSEMPQVEQKEAISYSAHKMLNLVMNILDVRKYEDSKLKLEKSKQDLAKLWKNAMEQLKYLSEQKNITITQVKNQKIIANTDKELLERVFVNVLSNSLKYSMQNSEIKFYTETRGSNSVKIVVEDNGIGISEKDIETIFKKYDQSGEKVSYSTGLGLTFCKIAIEEHGGKIGIESEENKGTKIWFIIPETKIIDKEIKTETGKEEIIKPKSELKKFLPLFKEADVYQITSLKKILVAINKEGLGKESWVKSLSFAIANCNNEQYSHLLEILEEA